MGASVYVFWRPVTAIQKGDHDGNPRTVDAPTWQPLINTPNFPKYTSGHATYSGTVAKMLALFFGTDKLFFSVTSANALTMQKARTFSRFSDAAKEVVGARVYTGIHFRTSDEVGWRRGKQVARWAFKHFLRPVR
ncbi:MAG TPA: vanadium-dependent haloperoxidase [Methylomirabilota bacterium]|jgi:hypothetical protein|nr:vanadium-dependent haloperoxidase [Methylomirabilota bacterium]